MWNGKRNKETTKNRAQLLRRFLLGEDVTESILTEGLPVITGMWLDDDMFMGIDQDTSKATWFTGKSIGYGAPKWYDKGNEANYPDPEIKGVFYSRKENVPELPREAITSPLTRSVLNDTDSSKDERKLKGKAFLQQKLKEFDEQEKIDLVVREQMMLWSKMNSQFL